MRILVVGGAGYIGLAVSEVLRKLGHDVWVLDIKDQMRPFILNLKIKYVVGSVIDLSLNNKIMAEFDTIINLTGGLDDAKLYGMGPMFISQACSAMYLKRASEHAKIVHISTQYVYGSSAPGELEMHSEREHTRAECDYGIAHVMAEQAISSDERAAILRFGTVWGNTRNTRWDTWGNHLHSLRRKGELIDLYHPHRTISMLTIQNAVKVIQWVIEEDIAGTYNVADRVGLREDTAREFLGDYPYTNRALSEGFSIGMNCNRVKKAGFEFEDNTPEFEDE